MQRNIGFLTVLLAMLVASQFGCQRETPTNEPARPSNVNATPETVDKAAIESELLRIENDWPRVLRERDVAAIRRVEDEEAIFIDPDGNLRNRSQDIQDIESGALSAESWEVTDLKATVPNNDA